ncbi:zinc-dependent peptidase [Verticiella sediminum]|uniref:Zinc-dependent peptidase n=1 Tax=Verticiella sediminum TaxID=1247510 RepID=A0A556AZK5_9BURK|nr:M90 family metallopeptidase [Verticiella sediminum]TSH98367.1 zinc-dependent peptidase [Verticiella sediminum]
MFKWLMGRGANARDVARTAARIPPEAWRGLLERHPFLRGLSPAETEALQQRTAWLLASKSFAGAAGLAVTDEIMLAIAVQAALPVLGLDPALYEGWREIIVYPGGFRIPRQDMDEAGVVHEYVQDASGEAWDGGPVILSWEDVGRSDGAMNVVIHEFAHKLDLQAGEADGMPWLGRHPALSARQWRRVLDESYARFVDAVDAVEAAIPRDVDPEGPEADAWYAALPLDPYAATDEAEFFAVSSEAFFVDPEPLATALPDWYGLLRSYYRQDPLLRLRASGLPAPGGTDDS